jgi:hypothetical protein
MEWILIALLTVALIYFILLYRRGLHQRNALESFVILILLHETVYQTQRNGLIELVRGIKAKNAMDLSSMVIVSLGHLADRLASSATGSSILGGHAALWHLKQQLDKTSDGNA